MRMLLRLSVSKYSTSVWWLDIQIFYITGKVRLAGLFLQDLASMMEKGVSGGDARTFNRLMFSIYWFLLPFFIICFE